MPNLEGELSGRLALVTGASRGIGESIALELGQAGAMVVGTGASAESAEAITANLAAHDIEGFGVEMDLLTLGEEEYAERLAAIAEQAGSAVSILVNNAGIRRDNLALKMSPAEVTEVIKVDLVAPIVLTNAVIRGMMRAKKGDIVHIGSAAGTLGHAGQSNYAAAKNGLVAHAKSIAQEYGEKGIKANVVAPGFVETDMTAGLTEEDKARIIAMSKIGRPITPTEIAKVVYDVITGDQNGQLIGADGGLTPDSVI